jgi:hypothetical protein
LTRAAAADVLDKAAQQSGGKPVPADALDAICRILTDELDVPVRKLKTIITEHPTLLDLQNAQVGQLSAGYRPPCGGGSLPLTLHFLCMLSHSLQLWLLVLA